MRVSVQLNTILEFEYINDINEAYSLIVEDMSPVDILMMADNLGSPVNIDVDAI